MSKILKLVKQMCDTTVEAARKEVISGEEAEIRLSLIENLVNGDATQK